MFDMVIMGHKALAVESKKSGKQYSWYVMIIPENGKFSVHVSLSYDDNGTVGTRKTDKSFKSLENAYKFVNKFSDKFHIVEKKMLVFDQKYSTEETHKKILEWFVDKEV